MARESATVSTLAKQFAVGIGIATLLPLTVWYGVRLFHPPPERRTYFPEELEGMPQPTPPRGDEEGDKARLERTQRLEQFEAAERLYYRALFYVAYPIGLLAFIVGTFLHVQAVGAGSMFGGLFTLGEGCYSYWDKLGDGMRFGSLLVALAVVVVIGCWRFRRNGRE